MQIHGFNKTTLLDYPGIVAATVFTGSCNFRCPFCQNADLVLNPSGQPSIETEEIFKHLEKRKNITKGICITGGEPTLWNDLPKFILRCKEIGLLVKLDTNGYRPDVLKKLVEEKLIDYVAMDIKSSPKGYSEAAGVETDMEKIKESVDFLISGSLDYEFRTTVVRELHSRETMEDIALFIAGAKKYFLQGYQDSERVICRGYSAYSFEELKEFVPIFEKHIEKVEIRGVE